MELVGKFQAIAFSSFQFCIFQIFSLIVFSCFFLIIIIFSFKWRSSRRSKLFTLASFRVIPPILLRGHRIHFHNQPQLRIFHLLFGPNRQLLQRGPLSHRPSMESEVCVRGCQRLFTHFGVPEETVYGNRMGG